MNLVEALLVAATAYLAMGIVIAGLVRQTPEARQVSGREREKLFLVCILCWLPAVISTATEMIKEWWDGMHRH